MIGRRLLIAAPFAAAMPALAQSEWPKGQPIRVLIPFAPGGVPDIISRIALNVLTCCLMGTNTDA